MATWAQSEYDDFIFNFVVPIAGFQQMKGNSNARFPEWSGSISLGYNAALRNTGWNWFANTDVSYTTVDFTKPTLLIVGNEHRGVSEALIEESDLCVKIPMMGQINSLNIAVAASVTLFEASRQRLEASRQRLEASERVAEASDVG